MFYWFLLSFKCLNCPDIINMIIVSMCLQLCTARKSDSEPLCQAVSSENPLRGGCSCIKVYWCVYIHEVVL